MRRDTCNGQSLASPGRWPVEHRTYSEDETSRFVAGLGTDFSRRVGTPASLASLVVRRIAECPFSPDSIQTLKRSVIRGLAARGLSSARKGGHSQDIPVAQGWFDGGVRAGPGTRLPRLSALNRPKRKWRLADQEDTENHREEELAGDPSWVKNHSSLAALPDKTKDVLDDQSRRGQVLNLTDHEARKQYPELAALRENRKDKPNGVVSVRAFFDGSNDIAVNRRTPIRDQERAPVAADVKRVMRGTPADPDPHHVTGTCWGAKSRLEATCTSTKSEPSESPPICTTGQGQPQRSAD